MPYNHRTSGVAHIVYMGDVMVEKSLKINPKEEIYIDQINKDKMNFRVINHYPENKISKSKDIEKRLFDVFKKYEKMSWNSLLRDV